MNITAIPLQINLLYCDVNREKHSIQKSYTTYVPFPGGDVLAYSSIQTYFEIGNSGIEYWKLTIKIIKTRLNYIVGVVTQSVVRVIEYTFNICFLVSFLRVQVFGRGWDGMGRYSAVMKLMMILRELLFLIVSGQTKPFRISVLHFIDLIDSLSLNVMLPFGCQRAWAKVKEVTLRFYNWLDNL